MTAAVFLADGEREAGRLTYAQLDLRARAVAAVLQSRGAVGQRVLIAYPSSLDYVVAFLGCLYSGAVAVPCSAPRRRSEVQRLRVVAADSSPVLLLGSGLGGQGFIPTLDVADVPADAAVDWREPDPDPDAIALLQYTSGSTQDPRGVMISHGNVMANERSIALAMKHDKDSALLGWLPIHHDMGLFGDLLQPLYLGSSSIFMPPEAFLEKPVRWLRAISRYRCTTSGGPNFAYQLCVARISPDDRAGLDLSAWRVAFNGSEVVRPATLRQFAAVFGPVGFRPDAPFPCYGLAEATLIVSGSTETGPPRTVNADPVALRRGQLLEATTEGSGRSLSACGRSVDGCSVVIVDPQTEQACPPGKVGEIWVAGPHVARGYWGHAAATDETFNGVVAGHCAQTFLRTGDLGVLHGGQLVVVGRIKDLVVVRGQNHYPTDLEWTAEASHDALRPTCGGAFAIERDGEERLVIAYEVRRNRRVDVEEVARAIRNKVSESHGIEVPGVVLVEPGGVPKTTSGKVRRNACREAFVAGELPVLAMSWREPVVSGLAGLPDRIQLVELGSVDAATALAVAILHASATRFGIDPQPLDVTHPLSAVGMDSLAMAELRHALQHRYGVHVPPLAGFTFLDVAHEVCDALPWPERAESAPAEATGSG